MNLHEQAVDTLEKLLVTYERVYKDKALSILVNRLHNAIEEPPKPRIRGSEGCCGMAEFIGVQNISHTNLENAEQLAKKRGYALSIATIPTCWHSTEATFSGSGWELLRVWTNVRTGVEIGLWAKVTWYGTTWRD